MDKWLLITTGTFSNEARKEAKRNGAPPVDLIDGTELAIKLKELKLGIDIEFVPKVIVRKHWYQDL